MTSGAIQNGVPMTVFLFAIVSYGKKVVIDGKRYNEPSILRWAKMKKTTGP